MIELEGTVYHSLAIKNLDSYYVFKIDGHKPKQIFHLKKSSWT